MYASTVPANVADGQGLHSKTPNATSLTRVPGIHFGIKSTNALLDGRYCNDAAEAEKKRRNREKFRSKFADIV